MLSIPELLPCSISTTQLFDIEQLRLRLRAVIGEKRKRYKDTEERSIEDAVGTAFALWRVRDKRLAHL